MKCDETASLASTQIFMFNSFNSFHEEEAVFFIDEPRL